MFDTSFGMGKGRYKDSGNDKGCDGRGLQRTLRVQSHLGKRSRLRWEGREDPMTSFRVLTALTKAI